MSQFPQSNPIGQNGRFGREWYQYFQNLGGGVVNVPDPSGGEDSTAIQSAVASLQPGGTLLFPQGKVYQIDGPSVVISTTGVTIDLNGSQVIAPTTDSVPAFALIPASLVASGRLTGDDYPASWRAAGVPIPMDLDFDTMMFEETFSKRLSNITIRNARCDATCNRTFLKAYSVDGLRFINCNLAPSTNSAVRANHCSQIVADKTNFFGGTGTYIFAGLKCLLPSIDATFASTSSIRACSFKGALHPITVSIFDDFGSSFANFNGRFGGTIIDGIDGVFWDTTPFYTEDAVGARGGTPIGFTSGSWYGKGRGFSVNARISLPSCTAGGGQGRAVWMSAPHQDILLDGCGFIDSTIFTAGVVSGKARGNKFYYSKAISYSFENQGDSVTGTDATAWDVTGNQVYGWQPTGAITSPFRMGFTGGKFCDNEVFSPGTGTLNMVAWAGNFSGISDYVIAEGNKVFHALGSAPAFGTFGSNNTHGWASNNLIIDTTGILPNASTGFRTADDGTGSAYKVTVNNDATGVGGFAVYNRLGTALQAQHYWDVAGAKYLFYVGAERMAISATGVSFSTGLYPPKDDGVVQATCRLYAGTGVPNNANGTNGDYYLRSDTPGTANQRLYVRAAGAWAGIV